ncbi:hypothetical protein GQ53DRAFT_13691 [Thozetella sp. PMI_491]|nr:hypothetical protein GQ53DRAFT_13691 [Thozetella sp. PMI_491]
MSGHVKLSDFPINETWSPKVNRLYTLLSAKGFSKIAQVMDLTSNVDLNQYDGVLSDDLAQEAEAATKEANAAGSMPLLTMHRRAWYSSHMRFNDSSGKPVSELNTSIWKHGVWRMGFPPDSKHSTHEIEMKPTGIGHSDEIFKKDDDIYFWHMRGNMEGVLYKVVHGRRLQIGEFRARQTTQKDCVLIVNSDQLDEVVAIMSCVALLNRIDSFDWAWGDQEYPAMTLPQVAP